MYGCFFNSYVHGYVLQIRSYVSVLFLKANKLCCLIVKLWCVGNLKQQKKKAIKVAKKINFLNNHKIQDAVYIQATNITKPGW